MAEKLEFDLLVKQNDLSKTLKEASTQAQTLSSVFAGAQPAVNNLSASVSSLNSEIKKTAKETGFASDFMEQFKTQALGVAAGQFAFNAITSAINFLKTSITESVAAFSESEDAINRLNQALNLTGSYSESSSEGVQEFAAQIQASSKYSDEAVLSQFNFAKSLGLTTDQAKNLTSAAVEISAQLGGSLEENTTKLAKTLSGDLPRSLSALIPELKTLSQEQLRNGEAADIINKKYSGSAANELKTYSGQIASLKNSYNDLQERVGENIAKNSIWQNGLKLLKGTIDELNESAKTEKTLIENTNGSSSAASKTREQLAGDYQSLTKRIDELNKEYERNVNFEKQVGTFGSGVTASVSLKRTIDEIQATKDLIEEKLKYQKLSAPKEKIEVAQDIGATDEQQASLEKAKAKTLQIEQEIALERKKIRDNDAISVITEEEGRREAEIASILEFETRKAEIDAQLKEKELSTKLSQQEKTAEIVRIGKEKELAILQASGKSQAALADESDKKEKLRKQQAAAFELQTLNTRAQYISAFGNLAAALAADGSRAQFIVQKSAAIAGSIVATQLAAAQALAVPPAPNLALAATANTIGNINTAAIVATAIKGFEQGGFVGGLNGASVGSDNRVAQVRDGEMILNATQQKNLMDMINAGGGSSSPIIIQIDGREIAVAVRNQVQAGFRLA